MSVTSSFSNRKDTDRSAKKPWRAIYARTSSSRSAPFLADMSASTAQAIEGFRNEAAIADIVLLSDLFSDDVRSFERSGG
jgi:hypothetical protein